MCEILCHDEIEKYEEDDADEGNVDLHYIWLSITKLY